MMGDEGGGYWFGKQALSLATKADDGRGEPTILTTMLPDWFGVDTMRSIHKKMYRSEISKTEITGAAQVVCRAAAMGDQVALDLVANGAYELAKAVETVIRRLGFEHRVPVSYMGGLFKSGDVILAPLRCALRSLLGYDPLRPPRYHILAGVLMTGVREHGIKIDKGAVQFLQHNLERSANSAI